MQFWDTSATRWSLPFPQATHDPTHKSTWYTSTKSWWLCQKQKTYLESLEEMKVVVCLSNYEDVCLVQDEKLWALSACSGADVLTTLILLIFRIPPPCDIDLCSGIFGETWSWTARQSHTSELDSLGSLEDNHENGYLRWDIIQTRESELRFGYLEVDMIERHVLTIHLFLVEVSSYKGISITSFMIAS